jgi:hypothetical protein
MSPSWSGSLRRQKLIQLADSEGMTADEIIESVFVDSVCPAICMNDGCDYTTDMEPDQDRGFCEVCETNSVASALILAGLI